MSSRRRQRSISPTTNGHRHQHEEYHRSQSRAAAQQLRDRYSTNSTSSSNFRDEDGFRHPQRLMLNGDTTDNSHRKQRQHDHHVANDDDDDDDEDDYTKKNRSNFRSAQTSLSRRRRNGEAVFSGLLSAPVSPFDPSTGRCDTSVIDDYAALHRRDGVDGVFCNGTTGESQSLTVRERMDCAEAWVRTGLQTCVHIGTQSLLDTQKLARHAQDCGAHGIAVIVPFTVAKPNTIDAYVDYLEQVYRAAPEIPMLVYHFPTLTNVPFKLFDILSKALERGSIPTLCGAKFTSWDLADYVACKNIGGQITDVIYSIEGNLAGAAFLGARTFVGMQFSMIAPIYRRVADAARRGDADKAQRENSRACDFIQKMGKVGTTLEKLVAITKYIVGYRLRRDIGEPRLPGARLSAEEKNIIAKTLFPFFDRVDVGDVVRRNDNDSSFSARNSFNNNNNNNTILGSSPSFSNKKQKNNNNDDETFRPSIHATEYSSNNDFVAGSRSSPKNNKNNAYKLIL